VTARSTPIRRLGPADHASCVVAVPGPLLEPRTTQMVSAAGPVRPFGIDAPDGGGLADAVVLTRYGGNLAALGMMLVATRYGRTGLGRAIMDHALGVAGQATVVLTATRMGRPLYEKLGFTPLRRSAAFRSEFTADPGPVIPAAPRQWLRS
jgi:GNAT superfamily N-acetyltransferase